MVEGSVPSVLSYIVLLLVLQQLVLQTRDLFALLAAAALRGRQFIAQGLHYTLNLGQFRRLIVSLFHINFEKL